METCELGKRIAQVRKRRGYSQDGLAYLCKMNIRSIQRIEAGQVRPRPHTLRVLSEVLDYDFLCENQHEGRRTIRNWIKNIWMSLIVLYEKGVDAMKDENVFQKMRKSQTDKKIAGICGGLGEYTSIPSWFWRILFLFFTVFYGIGLVLYILFWIFMPQARDSQTGYSASPNWLNQYRRSGEDKKIAGVCGGLGTTTAVPSWMWRILFIMATFVYGSGLILYVLLWIFAPGAGEEPATPSVASA